MVSREQTRKTMKYYGIELTIRESVMKDDQKISLTHEQWIQTNCQLNSIASERSKFIEGRRFFSSQQSMYKKCKTKKNPFNLHMRIDSMKFKTLRTRRDEIYFRFQCNRSWTIFSFDLFFVCERCVQSPLVLISHDGRNRSEAHVVTRAAKKLHFKNFIEIMKLND